MCVYVCVLRARAIVAKFSSAEGKNFPLELTLFSRDKSLFDAGAAVADVDSA